jgi:primosomal protein N''
MEIDQALADILDETVEALSNLDSAKLHVLTQRIAVFAEANMNHERDDIDLVLLKKRRLEIMLQNCQTNLDALTRLHARNMRNQWEQ